MTADATTCREAWPTALKYGEVIECVKTDPNHRRHRNVEDTLRWWGPRLSEADAVEADRLRALGGKDPEKALAYIEQLRPGHAEAVDRR